MPATCDAGAPALRPAGPPCSLTPPHIPVRRLPASAGSFPTIPRLKAAHRESLQAEALDQRLGVDLAPLVLILALQLAGMLLAGLQASWLY